jgi:hypothetical protein
MATHAAGKRPADTGADVESAALAAVSSLAAPQTDAKRARADSAPSRTFRFLSCMNGESVEQLTKQSKGELVAKCAARGLPTTGLKPILAARIVESTPWQRVEIDESAEMWEFVAFLLDTWKYDNVHLFSLQKLPSAAEQAARTARAAADKDFYKRERRGEATQAEIDDHRNRLWGGEEESEDEEDKPEKVLSWGGPAFGDTGFAGDSLGFGCSGSVRTTLAAANLATGDKLKLSYDQHSSHALFATLTVEAITTGVSLPVADDDDDEHSYLYAKVIDQSARKPFKQYS